MIKELLELFLQALFCTNTNFIVILDNEEQTNACLGGDLDGITNMLTTIFKNVKEGKGNTAEQKFVEFVKKAMEDGESV